MIGFTDWVKFSFVVNSLALWPCGELVFLWVLKELISLVGIFLLINSWINNNS